MPRPQEPQAEPTAQQQVRKLELSTKALVNHFLAGAYHSLFKGQGVEFAEVRGYQRGDDVRTIDWNVTARTGALHIKRYQEERELSVLLVVDTSGSMKFGSGVQSKAELAAAVSTLLAFAAMKNNDRVGLLLFADRLIKFVRPRKGRKHVQRLISEIILQQRRPSGTTDLQAALDFIARTVHRRSIVFILSDFFSADCTRAIKMMQRRHDCIAMVLNDKRENDLPPAGWLRLRDIEGEEEIEINTSDTEARKEYRTYALTRMRARLNYFAAQHLDTVNLFTDTSYVKPLARFFRERKKRLAL
jgi:uncharacterized protein (DUF58 family)